MGARSLVENAAARRLFQSPRALRVLSRLARHPVGRRVLTRFETRLLTRMLERTRTPGPDGRALGYLFDRYEPGRAAREIYVDVFSARRFELGYRSQMGQDLFLNRWIFKDRGPGFFVDVGAFDGELGSNTAFFEKRLGWTGVAFEPNPPEFAALSRTRSCRVIQGCAYNRDGEVSFLAVSERDRPPRTQPLPPPNLTSMALDPRHGAVMLSGIHEHVGSSERIDGLRQVCDLDQSLITVPCYRIDRVLDEADVRTVDYLTVDVEGAELPVLEGIDFCRVRINVVGVESSPRFPEVHRLLTRAGFEYEGLLFFDEIFVNREPCFTWES